MRLWTTEFIVRLFYYLIKKIYILSIYFQESFWRISGKLSAEKLREAASSLVLSSPEEQPIDVPIDSDDQGSNLEQRAEALRALLLARKKKTAIAPQGKRVNFYFYFFI